MGDEIAALEINNQTYANFMRQLFQLAWHRATSVDNFGQMY